MADGSHLVKRPRVIWGTVKPHLRKHYNAWTQMHQRCTNPANKDFARYGGRGISICERWYDFLAFVSDMGERPENTSIDRIDNNGNYEPGNCRWTTQAEQSRNRSGTIWIDDDGRKVTLKEYCRDHDLPYSQTVTLVRRGLPLSLVQKRYHSCSTTRKSWVRLTEQQAEEIRTLHANGVLRSKLAAEYGVSKTTVFNIVNRLNGWKEIEP